MGGAERADAKDKSLIYVQLASASANAENINKCLLLDGPFLLSCLSFHPCFSPP